MTLRRTLRYYWLKFLRLQEEPRQIAGGMALGIFVGFTPTVPFHTVAILFLAPLLRVSPIAGILGAQICNPLTIPPLYLAAYKVGQFLLYRGKPLVIPVTHGFREWLDLLWDGGLALQVGGLVLAIPPAIVSYFLTLWIVRRYRQHKGPKPNGVFDFSQNSPPPPGTDA
jgi:uncharacterized protein